MHIGIGPKHAKVASSLSHVTLNTWVEKGGSTYTEKTWGDKIRVLRRWASKSVKSTPWRCHLMLIASCICQLWRCHNSGDLMQLLFRQTLQKCHVKLSIKVTFNASCLHLSRVNWHSIYFDIPMFISDHACSLYRLFFPSSLGDVSPGKLVFLSSSELLSLSTSTSSVLLFLFIAFVPLERCVFEVVSSTFS